MGRSEKVQPRVVVCEKCGKSFEATHHAQKYCSKACAQRMQLVKSAEASRLKREKKSEKPPRYCTRCGGELPYGSTVRRKYCEECQKALKKEAARKRRCEGETEGHHRGQRYALVCEMCGEPFEGGAHNAKYCEDCKQRKLRNTKMLSIAKRNGREVYCNVCAVCGLPFNTLSNDRTMCVDCARETKQESVRKKKAAKPVVSLAEQMRIIAEYNRVHGTELSYGKYMAMMRAKEGEARVKVRL